MIKKDSYLFRAWEYIKSFEPHVQNWTDTDAIIEAIDKTFFHTGKNVKFEYGAVRFVLIGKDFVIKWDYNAECAEGIGGCEDELRVYRQNMSSGYAHLLAPCSRVYWHGRYFYIMPRIDNIGKKAHHYKEIQCFVSAAEFHWLRNNIGDLHSWNWGIKDGHAVVIDYACPHRE